MEGLPQAKGNKLTLERWKNLHGWLMVAGIAAAVVVPAAVGLAAIEGGHVLATNSLEDELRIRRKHS